MKSSEEAEQIIAQLRKELLEVKEENKELKELLKEANQQIKFLEEAFEKLRRELRKYHNENTPSGAVPPYLRPVIEIKREVGENETPENDKVKIEVSEYDPDQGKIVYRYR